ncbi:MAG: hypothetical protein NVS3B24_00660 [Candidatus Dormibacteria bacterium]
MAVSVVSSQQAEGRKVSERPSRGRVRLRMLLVAAIVSGITASAGVQFLTDARAAGARYDGARAQAEAAVALAQSQGYSADDLTPILAGLAADRSRPAPNLLEKASFYERRRTGVLDLLGTLPALEAAAMARRRSAAQDTVAQASGGVDAARSQGADPEQIDPLKLRLEKVVSGLAAAATPKDVDALVVAAGLVLQEAATAGAAAMAEQTQLTQAAEALKSQYAGNLDQLRAAGTAAMAPGRNDGTAATLLKIGGTGSLLARLEHYGSLLSGTDVNQLALAAAGAQAYQKRIHDLLISRMPSQTITLSLTAQELWAYQDGKIVQDSLVTTGRPDLPTDVGAMKVLWRQSPWKMHSPWPRSSPYWYPDSMVQKVVWFTITGEGFHDSSWEPASLYGPGGQFTSSASHGCVHVPLAAESFLYDWAQVGASVIVYPGDGTPVADQMKQVSVDDNGVPFTGPKGA